MVIPSPKRDEEIFEYIENTFNQPGNIPVSNDIVKELLNIAKKWRSKAIMRENKIKELDKH